MSDRGTLVIDVQHGLGEVLAVLDAQWWPESIVDERGRWLPIDDQQVWRAHPGQAGTVTFTDVAHPTVVDLLADAAPNAIWQAWCDERGEAPNTWYAHHPDSGLLAGHHIGHQVVVPVSWTDPATRTVDEQRWLARFHTFHQALTETGRTVTLTWHAGFGRIPTEDLLAEYAQRGLDPHARATYRLTGLPEDLLDACEALFEATNTYTGLLWRQLRAQGLPDRRGHTALSIGDDVTVDGATWRCTQLGWQRLEDRPDADPLLTGLDAPVAHAGPTSKELTR